MVMRATLGRRGGRGRSIRNRCMRVSLHSGLKVVMPSTPYDAKGLLNRPSGDDNPVLYEDKMMYS